MKSPSGRFTDWPAIISRAKKADGAFILASSDELASVLYTVRERKARALHHADGYLIAELRNRHVDEDDRVRGDLYTAWVRAKV